MADMDESDLESKLTLDFGKKKPKKKSAKQAPPPSTPADPASALEASLAQKPRKATPPKPQTPKGHSLADRLKATGKDRSAETPEATPDLTNLSPDPARPASRRPAAPTAPPPPSTKKPAAPAAAKKPKTAPPPVEARKPQKMSAVQPQAPAAKPAPPATQQATPAPPVEPQTKERPRVPAASGVPAPEVEASDDSFKIPMPNLQLPEVKPWMAAAIAGAVAGFGAALMYFFADQSCKMVRGPGGCAGVQLLYVILILAAAAYLGAVALNSWKQLDPIATSALGVGLMSLIIMLTLLSYTDRFWMILVIPIIGAISFLASWWLTTGVVAKADDDWHGGPIN